MCLLGRNKKYFLLQAVISPSGFNEFAKTQLLPGICQKAEKATCLQADTPLWHELRYGRITASKLHAAAHCHTLDGSLVEQILGARVKETEAMKRGTRLEKAVKMALSKKLGCKITDSGFLLDQEFPVFGASPDGVSEEFIVEIKCPVSSQTEKGYFTADGSAPAPKHFAQMQLQMLFAKKTKGCFCVANPNFEDNKDIKEMWVMFDEDYCMNLMSRAYDFWKVAIYCKLAK